MCKRNATSRRSVAAGQRWVAGVAMAAGLATLAIAAGDALAQQQLTPSGSRDCKTVRTCNFSRTGAVRGCLSSYTCRKCRLVVTARCGLPGKVCQEMVCSWGG